MPIQVSLEWADKDEDEREDQTLTNLSLGGLSFLSPDALPEGERVRFCIPILKQESYLIGTVVWCEESTQGFEIGLEFDRSKDMFRLRMIEQVCHIEHYRKEVARVEGRILSTQEAAAEWISKYAGDFPAL